MQPVPRQSRMYRKGIIDKVMRLISITIPLVVLIIILAIIAGIFYSTTFLSISYILELTILTILAICIGITAYIQYLIVRTIESRFTGTLPYTTIPQQLYALPPQYQSQPIPPPPQYVPQYMPHRPTQKPTEKPMLKTVEKPPIAPPKPSQKPSQSERKS